ncbi:hypothetical protein T492DRAFT_1149371 [Pavlovales sp. CCMP2436]|nr:hypothetical protein T492DRAFT_1149371 [Pavlovales sp. CCMP2436]
MGTPADVRRQISRVLAQHHCAAPVLVHQFLEHESGTVDEFAAGDTALLVMCREPQVVDGFFSRAPDVKQELIFVDDSTPVKGTVAFFLPRAPVLPAEGGAAPPPSAVEGFESGSFFGGVPLEVLTAYLQEIYLPMLSAGVPKDGGGGGEDDEGEGQFALEPDAAARRPKRLQGWAAQHSEEATNELLAGMREFGGALADLIKSKAAAVQLRRPESRMEVENKPPTIQRAAHDSAIVQHYEELVEEWSDAVEELLEWVNGDDHDVYTTAAKSGVTAAGGGAGAAAAVAAAIAATSAEDRTGPQGEFEQWQVRVNSLTSVLDQCKGAHECKTVLAVLAAAKSKASRRWKALELAVSDALKEARESIKSLAVIEKQVQPLYDGTPAEMGELLPGLFSAVRALQSVSRFYSGSERASALLGKCANQMLARCRAYVEGPDGLWAQTPSAVLAKLRECLALNDAFGSAYKAREKATVFNKEGGQRSRALDLNEGTVFNKFGYFCRRVEKLVELFTAIEQFCTLEESQIGGLGKVEGIGAALVAFHALVVGLQGARYRMLDHTHSGFDRDYVELGAAVVDAEGALLQIVNSSFERAASTDAAFALLRQFKAIMQRASLRDDLESKLIAIFGKYTADLEAVQAMYEAHRTAPPIGRNTPPVAGAIAWARQLLLRIEGPMMVFTESAQLTMGTREAKKTVKMYNRIARTLIEFEYLWTEAWGKAIEAQRAGIMATLLVRHPESKAYAINLDPQVLLLCAEAKALSRMGVAVPERAMLCLFQLPRIKAYHAQLDHALREYATLVACVKVITRPLIRPLLAELERRFQPGLSTLTWASMNIDGFLHVLNAGLRAVKELMGRVRDLTENRIERQIRVVGAMRLLDLDPARETLSLDEFLQIQDTRLREQGQRLRARAGEIEEAVGDLVELIGTFTIAGRVPVGDAQAQALFKPSTVAVRGLRAYYSRLLYRAVSGAVRAALRELKVRLSGRDAGALAGVDGGMLVVHAAVDRAGAAASAQGGVEPALLGSEALFSLSVQLSVPAISLSPSVADAQRAINSVCKLLLAVTKKVPLHFGGGNVGGSMFDELAADREVVTMLLLLTGSVERARRSVQAFLDSLGAFAWLWDMGLGDKYARFRGGDPTTAQFDAQLGKIALTELGASQLPTSARICGLRLQTAPLRASLRAELASWKARYLRVLHERAAPTLFGVSASLGARERALLRDVGDLEALRQRMADLQEVRALEGTIDEQFEPVEEMYAVLRAHGAVVPERELETLGRLRYEWRQVARIADDVRESLRVQQAGFQKVLVAQVNALKAETAVVRADFDQHGPALPGLPPLDALARLRNFQLLADEKAARVATLERGERLFGLPPSEYPDLAEVRADTRALATLYDVLDDAAQAERRWLARPWAEVVRAAVSGRPAAAAGAGRRVDQSVGPQGLTGEVATIGAALDDFEARAHAVERGLHELPAFGALGALVGRWRRLCAPLQQLSLPLMRSRHWTQVMALLRTRLSVGTRDFLLGELVSAGLEEFAEAVGDLADDARREHLIEARLHALASEWGDALLPVGPYRERGALALRGRETAALVDALDESHAALALMVGQARHVAPFREQVALWTERLAVVGDTLELWSGVQATWLYLEPIFEAGDIGRQLPRETARFRQADTSWARLMGEAADARNIVTFCVSSEWLRPLLAQLRVQLDQCQQALGGYLERKRALFPRFYFLADAELLALLARGSEPAAAQAHLPGLFDSIGALAISKAAAPPTAPRTRPGAPRPGSGRLRATSPALPTPPVTPVSARGGPQPPAAPAPAHTPARARVALQGAVSVTHVICADGQSLALEEAVLVSPGDHAEAWLSELLQAARAAVQRNLIDASAEMGGAPLGRFVRAHVSQVAHVCLQLAWAAECDDALRRAAGGDRSALKESAKKQAARLGELAALAAPTDAELVARAADDAREAHEAPADSGSTPRADSAFPAQQRGAQADGRPPPPPGGTVRLKIEGLVVLAVHQRDIFEATAREARAGNREAYEFTWARNLRTEWDPESGEPRVCVANASLAYGHELLGAREALVVTPLTERCFVGFTQALHLCLAGAAVGPTGTGKTESVKALGQAAGRWVLVSNCSEGTRASAMANQLKGLAQSGCWGCFDEFNRVGVQQLALVGLQLASVLAALAAVRARAALGGGLPGPPRGLAAQGAARPGGLLPELSAADGGARFGSAPRFTFADGTPCALDVGVGLFVTLNPASAGAGGYGGRQQLPESVKQLLRASVLAVPERAQIVRVKLLAAGYAEAELLARKLDVLLRLCAQQLSEQPQYDWGLRATMATVRTAADRRRASCALRSPPPETELLVRAVREQTLPRLAPDDEPLFAVLLEDIFGAAAVAAVVSPPLADVSRAGSVVAGFGLPYGSLAGQQAAGGGGPRGSAHARLERGLRGALAAEGLAPTEGILLKGRQLADCAAARHAVAIIGPAGSGKSALLNAYLRAMSNGDVVTDAAPPPGRPRRVSTQPGSTGGRPGSGARLLRKQQTAGGLLAADRAGRSGGVRRTTTDIPAEQPQAAQLVATVAATTAAFVPAAAGAPAPPAQPAAGGASMPVGWGVPHQKVRFFPRAMGLGELFGRVDAISGEWADGAFTAMWRRANSEGKRHTWLVLDGPVEPEWVEDLNSVMDDNMLLTLPSSERLPMLRPNVTLALESADLAHASPATVSRVAVVFVDEAAIGWQASAGALLHRLVSSAQVAWSVEEMLAELLERALELVQTDCAPMVALRVESVAQMLVSLFAAQLGRLDSVEDADEDAVERFFVSALVIAVGGVLDAGDRAKFDAFLRNDLRPELLPPNETGTTVFDFALTVTARWQPLAQLLPEWQPPSGLTQPELAEAFPAMVVPTPETVRVEGLLALCVEARRSPLLVGGAGTGKTTLALAHAADAGEEDAAWHYFALCGATSPRTLQRALERRLERRQGRSHGAPGGKASFVLVVDDVSAAPRDRYGTAPCAELLRQLLEGAGLLCAERPGEEWPVRGLRLVLAMRTRAGGAGSGSQPIPSDKASVLDYGEGKPKNFGVGSAANAIAAAQPEQLLGPRCARHLLPVGIVQQSADALALAFTPVLEFFLDGSNSAVQIVEPDVELMAATLVDLTLDVYARVGDRTKPTPLHAHYTFSLREVCRILHALLCVRLEGILLNENTVLGLWAHEAAAVLAARVGDESEREAVLGEIKAAMASVVSFTSADICLGQEPWFWSHFGSNETRKQVGAAFAVADPQDEPGPARATSAGASRAAGKPGVAGGQRAKRAHRAAYEPARDTEEFGEFATSCEERFNASLQARGDPLSDLRLVFFDEALQQLSRLVRQLRTPRGSALLVGTGGSGKRSLVRLAAYIAGCELVRLRAPTDVSAGGGGGGGARARGAPRPVDEGAAGSALPLGPLFDEMRRELRGAGLDGRAYALMLTDVELADDGWLEQLHAFLSTGEPVPDVALGAHAAGGDSGAESGGAGGGGGQARVSACMLGGGLFSADEVDAVLLATHALFMGERTARIKLSNDYGPWESAAARARGNVYADGPGGGGGGRGAPNAKVNLNAATIARQEILAELEAVNAVREMPPPTREQLWRWFVERARRQVHVLVCASPAEGALNARAVKFPSLFGEMHVEWFLPWSETALQGVAAKRLEGFSLSGASAQLRAQDQAERANEQLERSGGGGYGGGGGGGYGGDAAPNPLAGLIPGGGGGGGYLQGRGQGDELQESMDSAEQASKDGLLVHMAATHQLMRAFHREQSLLGDRRRRAHAPPKAFLAYIELFQHVYARHAEKLAAQQSVLLAGLGQLQGAADDAELIQTDLDEKEKALGMAQQRTVALLHDIVLSTTLAERKRREVGVEAAACAEEAEAAEAQRRSIEEQLARTQPVLDEAERAINAISQRDVSALKTMRAPPELTKRVFDCVLLLRRQTVEPLFETVALGEGPSLRHVPRDSWRCALAMLSEAHFLEALLGFDKASISEETLELLHPYLLSPDFTLAYAVRSSGSVGGVCVWVRAMAAYGETQREVKPRLAQLALANVALGRARERLGRANAALADSQGEVDRRQLEFDRAMAQRQQLGDNMRATNRRLELSAKLLGQLEEERLRWTVEAELGAERSSQLTAHAALAAALATYLGPYADAQLRADTLTARLGSNASGPAGLPVAEALDAALIVELLADGEQRARFSAQGLPSDALSLQNGAIVHATQRFALCIDPQGQARAWILRREARARVVPAYDPSGPGAAHARRRLLRALEQCVPAGLPLVLDGVGERLDSALGPLLARNVLARGSSGAVRAVIVGDVELGWSDEFRLYILCPLAAPVLAPELHAELCVVDFSVAAGALAEQLLALAVRAEAPELEAQRDASVRWAVELAAELARVEQHVLDLLANSTASLMVNSVVLDALDAAKTSAALTRAQIDEAAVAVRRIAEARDEYAPLASRGAALYLCMAELARAVPVYALEMRQFVGLFEKAIVHADRAAMRPRRVANIVDTLTAAASAHACRGMFAQHRELWPLLLALRVAVGSGLASVRSVRALLLGVDAAAGGAATLRSAGVELRKARSKKVPKEGAPVGGAAEGATPTRRADEGTAKGAPVLWLGEGVWQCLLSAAYAEPNLAEVPISIPRREAEWRAWFELPAPEAAQLPELGERATPIARLLLVRALRPDRFVFAATAFAAAVLGKRHAEPPRPGAPTFVHLPPAASAAAAAYAQGNGGSQALSVGGEWATVEAEADFGVPLLVLQAPGVDAAEAIGEAATLARVQLRTVALGPAAVDAARRALSECADRGEWLLFTSAHLAPAFLRELDGWLTAQAGAAAEAAASDGARSPEREEHSPNAAANRPTSATLTQRASSPAELLSRPGTPSRPTTASRPGLLSSGGANRPIGGARTKYVAAGDTPIAPRVGARGMALDADEIETLPDGAAAEEAVARKKARTRFRLWVCAEQVAELPHALLRRGLRLVAEPPVGLRAGLRAALSAVVGEETLDEVSHPHWQPVVLGLCFAHAALRERHAFGSAGWSAPYEWTHADLRAALAFARASLHAEASAPGVRRSAPAVNWHALQYVALDVHHGGRVTDAHDARVVGAYARQWLGPALAQPGFAFAPGYPLPDATDLAGARAAFEAMPATDEPSAFGLHAHADLVARAQAADRALEALASIHLAAGGASPTVLALGGSSAMSEVSTILVPINEMLARQPTMLFSHAERQNTLRALGGPRPLNLALLVEIELLERLLSHLRLSVRQVQLALELGTELPAGGAEMLRSLALAQVPAEWAAVARHVGGSSLGPWLSSVLLRAEQMTPIAKGHKPVSFLLAALGQPQGFLAAAVQDAVRKHAREGWTLDAAHMATRVMPFDREDAQARKQLEEGVYIHGLHLDGCRWDRAQSKVAEQQHRFLASTLPIVYVTAARLDELARTPSQLAHERLPSPPALHDRERPGSRAERPGSSVSRAEERSEVQSSASPVQPAAWACPCYKSPRRGAAHFVFDVDLRTDEPPDRWLLRAACILTQLDP